jgi:hypothetical protein
MLGINKKMITIIIASLFLLTGLPFLENAGINGNPSGSNVDALYSVPIYINNVQNKPTPTPFNEMIVVNSNNYSSYENSNLSNVFFTYTNGSIVPSWLESGNLSTDTNSTYWLRINDSIAPSSKLEIKMNFLPIGEIAFNNYSTGEAPYFSSSYGLYDDGAHVFNMYDNFSGTTLKGSIWNLTASKTSYITVDNGITFGGSGTYLVSNQKFNNSGYAEAYGVMNTPLSSDQISYFLGGVGFGNGSMDDTSPVMTTGWAENDTNGLGLSIWNGNGFTYTYNFSKSLNPDLYYIFGTGYINSSYTTGAINNTVQNYSKVGTGYSGQTVKLNVVIGFQVGNYPKVNHFYWVYERNTTSTGQNLPFSISTPTYPVTISSSGLGSNADWSIKITNVTSITEPSTGSSTINLFDGIYNYSIRSLNKSYEPVFSTGTFTVNGAPYNLVLQFKPVLYSQNVTEVGLPLGSKWTFSVVGNESYSSTTSSKVVMLMNGTYYVSVDSALGYQPYPQFFAINVSGNSNLYYIGFESPQNQTILRTNSTIYPLSEKVYPGYQLIIPPSFGSPFPNGAASIALDTLNNNLYYTNFAGGNISGYNVTSGQFDKNMSVGKQSEPFFIYYDNTSGYLYLFSVDQGNFTVINPETMSIISNIQINNLKDQPGIIRSSPVNPSELYLLGVNTSTSQMYLVVISTTGSMIHNYTLPKLINSTFMSLTFVSGVFPGVYGNNIILENDTAIIILNATTGKEAIINAPSGNILSESIQMGYSGNFIVGLNTTGSGKLLMFNASTLRFSLGINFNSVPISGVFDPLNGNEYITSRNISYNIAYIASINTSSDSQMASIPNAGINLASQFDQESQTLYTLSSFVLTASHSGYIVSYSVQHAYQAQFTESGLPSGSVWYVNISGYSSSGPISGGTYTRYLVNGTYTYTVSTANKLYHPSYSGIISVKGKTSTSEVSFITTYKLTFTESGLPSGTAWYVNLTGMAASGPITHNSYNISVQNGSYSFTVSTSDKTYAPDIYSGSVQVTGSPVTVPIITFTLQTYSVTFTESGLPSGTAWYVNLTNGMTSGSITGSSYSFVMSNGTYSYSISTAEKEYHPEFYTGSISVKGTTPVSVMFVKTVYMVTFHQSGLPADTTWSITINNVEHNVTTDSFNISLPNGTYSYTVSSVSGYSVSKGTGSVTVNGSAITVNVTFSKVSGLNVIDYSVIAVIAVILVSALVIFMRRRK